MFTAALHGRAGATIRSCSAVLAAALVLPCAAHAARTPAPLKLGVHVEEAPQSDFARIAAGGADMVRAPIKWPHVQPVADGPYLWAEYDTLIGNAAAAGLPVLPVIAGSPRYARPGPAEQPTRRVDRRRFIAFVTALAGRYGPGGAFWTERPEIPVHPIGAWQLWNEPNLSHYWAGAPDAREYVSLVRIMRRAIRSAQPDAKIVLAGMPEQHASRPASDFLAQMYEVRGFPRLFDVAAVHGYAKRGGGVATVVRRMRAALDAGGDESKPIWVTELGWGSAGPAKDPRVTTPEGQGQRLTEAFSTLSRLSAEYRVQRVLWYDWRDPVAPAGLPDHFSFHTGLFDLGGLPKPVWPVFVALAAGTDAGQGPLEPEPQPAPAP